MVSKISDKEKIQKKPTVPAIKSCRFTLKPNISPLKESKTKLNIPIFLLVKSSYIFWYKPCHW